jgi:hypothetical protein
VAVGPGAPCKGGTLLCLFLLVGGREKAVLASVEVVGRSLQGNTEENHEISQLGQSVTQTRFRHGFLLNPNQKRYGLRHLAPLRAKETEQNKLHFHNFEFQFSIPE